MNIIREKSNIQDKFINTVKTDGFYLKKLFEQMKSEKWSEDKLNNLLTNSAKVLHKFVSPILGNHAFTKILCLGKVQSGKTSFFISTLALAFDNGYDLAYVIGGTKNNLLTQNSDRIQTEFSNNNRYVMIADMNRISEKEVRTYLSNGIKVIIMVLKNKSGQVNLTNMEKLTKSLSNVPSIIIDDEGDEYSTGSKGIELDKNKGTVHLSIVSILSNVNTGTFLSVTATPQANLLISTGNALSPDWCFLVFPGDGYTGASVFHDTINNPLMCPSNDSQEFEESIPESFKKSFFEFLIGCAIRRFREIDEPHSMLIHPSMLTKVHANIFRKVRTHLELIRDTLKNPNDVYYKDLIIEIKDVFETLTFTKPVPSFDEIIRLISFNTIYTKVFEINGTTQNTIDEIEKDCFNIYRIYIGGGMIERGITLKNLSITYIYRVAKQNPIDTMLQRARWFGYKKEYLDLCKIYMPDDMIEIFVDIYNSEEFMWKSVEKYIESNQPIQMMKRIFLLSNPKNILTRTSIDKTVSVNQYIHVGYIYDRAITYSDDNYRLNNLKLINDFIGKSSKTGEFEYTTNTGKHIHSIFKVSLKEFVEEVIEKYNFPFLSTKLSKSVFRTTIELIEKGLMKDEILLIKMRDGENQFRSLDKTGKKILELPQSYDINNGYIGDKEIEKNTFSIQVHFNYIDKNENGSQQPIFPLLVINNPFLEPDMVDGLVTGENHANYN